MGNKKFTRRNFFRKLTAPVTNDAPGNGDDPLFKKYSRKRGGARRYSTEMVQVQAGTEESDVQRVGTPVTSGLAPYTGTWSEWEVLHLLRRTNFGWKKAWVDSLKALTPSAAVDAVLNVSATPPAPPVNWYQAINADANGIPLGGDWTEQFFATYTQEGQDTNNRRLEGLRRWLFGLALNGDVTIREKMVWFWYHFIPVDISTVTDAGPGINSARILYRYFRMFREAATGNFKALVKQMALQPSMMYYLNNQANTSTAPDENFARELMELFTLGKEPLRYSEDDVKAAARALTGWRVTGLNAATVTTAMNTTNTTSGRRHDNGEKVFSANFGANAKIAASTNPATWAGELDQLLDLIFGPAQQQYVGRYICRRLYRFFVYYDIDANVEANVIVPLAETFVNNGWNVKPVLEQLFKSQHFFDMANRGAYIKTPFDLVAGTLNAFNVNTTDANLEWQYRIWSRYNDTYSSGMEQRMGSIPNVAGWNPFYQAPAYHQYWINSNTIQKRFAFIRDIIATHTISPITVVNAQGTTVNRKFGIDTVAFAQLLGNDENGLPIAPYPNALVKASIRYLLPIDISDAQKEAIKKRTLLYQQTTDDYWTNAWNAYLAAPGDATKRKTVEDRLKNLYTEICQLAEYQLM